jgi:hypothetical protein
VFSIETGAPPLEVILDPDLRLFRHLMPQEATPILRQVMVNKTTVTVLLPESGPARDAAEVLATRLQHRAPKLIPGTDNMPATPTLVIGLQNQVDAWLARHELRRPEDMKGKGSAQAWTTRLSDGATLAVVSARDIESLTALTRPLPHYGRQSYVVFEGAKAVSRGTWPTRPQAVKLD